MRDKKAVTVRPNYFFILIIDTKKGHHKIMNHKIHYIMTIYSDGEFDEFILKLTDFS